MSKTTSQKAGKLVMKNKSGNAAKVIKAVKAARAAVARQPHKPKTVTAAKHSRSQPPHGKQPEFPNPSEAVASEAEVVVTKTIKWSAKEAKEFRERLQLLHDRAVEAIGFLGGGHLASSEDGVAGKSGGYSQDSTEDGTENFAQDLSLMQVSNKQDMLNKIIDAFRRLDQRTYGLCEECGCLIAKPRLEVQPFATKCIKCQSAAEANRPRSQGFRKSVVQMLDTDVG